MEEKEIKDFPVDPEQIQETLDKLCKIARSIAKVISNTFSEFWDRIGGMSFCSIRNYMKNRSGNI